MKRLLTLALALAAGLGTFARPATTAPEYNVAGVQGVILAFDAHREGFVVFNPRVGRLSVKVDFDRTRVSINGRPADLEDLRTGMHLIVSGPVSPVVQRMRANWIRVRQ